MPSRWENFAPFIPSLRNNSGLCRAPQDLHYLDGNKDAVCRCNSSRHYGRRRIRNPDIVARSVAFFRSNSNRTFCRREQWLAQSGLSALQHPWGVNGSIRGSPWYAYTHQQLLDMALAMFHEAYARGVSSLDALDEAEHFMSSHTGELISSTDEQFLLHSLPAFLFDATTAPDEDTDTFDGFSRVWDDLPSFGERRLRPFSSPPQSNPVPPSSGERSRSGRASRSQEYPREASARSSTICQPYWPTRAATEQRSTPAAGRGHAPDDLQRTQLHDQRWNASTSGSNDRVTDHTPATGQSGAPGDLQRAQLHDQRWNTGISGLDNTATDDTSANVPVSHQESRLPLDRPASDHRTQQNQATRSASGSSNSQGPTSQSGSVHLPSVSPPLRQNYVAQDNEIDEVKSTCLQLVLDVIPDVATGYVLALINETTTIRTSIRSHSGNVINRLLKAGSYPMDPNGLSNEDTGQVQLITETECLELMREDFRI